jgi:hypothetical protein
MDYTIIENQIDGKIKLLLSSFKSQFTLSNITYEKLFKREMPLKITTQKLKLSLKRAVIFLI